MLREDTQPQTITRLVRCELTRRYLTRDGWSENPAEAAHFADAMDAVRACVLRGLFNVELVLRFYGTDIFTARIR
jgi:hypothetical protein